MKLNRKGYMLAEIVVASVLAISIAYYLLNLTYKFKNTNEDLYQSYLYTQDKLLITKNIMSDLEKATVASVEEDLANNIIDFKIVIPDIGSFPEETRRLQIVEENGASKIIYGRTEEVNGEFIKSDISYYEKTLNKSLIVTSLDLTENNDNLTITIPIESIYDDNDYSIKIFVNKSQTEHNVDLGFIIDGTLSLGDELLNNNIKVKLKVNDEIYKNETDEEYINTLCDVFPYGTKIEISDIQQNGITIEGFTSKTFIISKDTSIRLHLKNNDTFNFEDAIADTYDSNNDICKNINS